MTVCDKSHPVTEGAKRDERDNNPIGLSRLSRPAPPEGKQWVWAAEGARLTEGVRVRLSHAELFEWRRVAQLRGVTLSIFIRTACAFLIYAEAGIEEGESAGRLGRKKGDAR